MEKKYNFYEEDRKYGTICVLCIFTKSSVLNYTINISSVCSRRNLEIKNRSTKGKTQELIIEVWAWASL